MSSAIAVPSTAPNRRPASGSSRLALGTGLAFASLILVPALAAQVGLGASLTGALRIALMKASSRAVNGTRAGADGVATSFSCH
ncbi:hypothetical protein EWI61_13660 [Methylolobus aquaticus]|nr:hypothetical protein EWI61_13660 [Methylolobus aquaticus]